MQDDWRATDKLTVNIGLRWEYVGPWFEKYNHYSNFDYETDPSNPQLVLATDGGIKERSTLNPDYNNFAPRVGLAYRATNKTVIRTGYGIYYGGVTHIGERYLPAVLLQLADQHGPHYPDRDPGARDSGRFDDFERVEPADDHAGSEQPDAVLATVELHDPAGALERPDGRDRIRRHEGHPPDAAL